MMEQFEQYKHVFEQWLILHPLLAGIVVFLLSLFESIAVIGMLLPGTVLMTTCGALVGAQLLPATPTILWAIAGAIIGDGLSYAVGYHYKAHLRELWPFCRYPKWIRNCENFFARHGGKSVFLGRLGPLRALVPIVAGMLSMRPLTFFAANIPASLLWAPAYMLPGILLGMASLQLPADTATRFLLYLFIAICILWGCGWFIKRILQWGWRKLDAWLDALWQYCQHHRLWQPLYTALQDPLLPERHGQLTSACILLVFSLFTGWLAYATAHQIGLQHIDQATHFFFRSWYSETGMKIAIVLTTLGDKFILLPLLIPIAIFLYVKRQWYSMWHWLAIGILASGSIVVLKHITHIPRPNDLLGSVNGMVLERFSFPSGHTTLSIGLWGFIAVMLARVSRPPYRWLSYTVAGAIISSVVFSRLYLGAHWLSDVVGGLLLGTCCLLITTISYRRRRIQDYHPVGLACVALLSFGLFSAIYLPYVWDTRIQQYTPKWPTYTVTANAWWRNQTHHIPLFRPNRFGHAVQLLNVQWRGDLATLRNTLSQHSWELIDNNSLQTMLQRLAAKPIDRRLPLLPVTYLNHRAVLTMIKSTPYPNVFLVLRLWDANITFAEDKQPLWLGAVDYVAPRDHVWSHHSSIDTAHLPAVLPSVIHDLGNLRWRQVNRHEKRQRPSSETPPQYPILLIQPAI